MIQKSLILFFCAFLIILTGCSDLDKIESPHKFITTIDDKVIVQGRWKKTTTSTSLSTLPKINTVCIECNKTNMRCEEILASIIDDNMIFLLNLKINYEIIAWTNDIINAKNDAPAADMEIKISVKDNLAERNIRETKARGSNTANPDIYEHYILE